MSINTKLPKRMSLTKEVELEETCVKFLVDTGSPVALVPHSVLRPSAKLRAADRRLCGYGVSELDVLGIADVYMS